MPGDHNIVSGTAGHQIPAAQENITGSDPIIFDADMHDFEAKVMHGSMDTPILADFWAPWCGPCKQLTPILEQAVQEAGGAVRLAKINIDQNQELAQALRIQSVPTVFAFYKGQPVTAFAGVKAAGEIKKLIDELVKMAGGAKPQAVSVETLLQAATQAQADGDIGTAQQYYMQVLAQDEQNVAAYTGLVRTLIDAGAQDEAQAMIDDAPDEIAAAPLFASVRESLALAKNAPSNAEIAGLAARVESHPDDLQAHYDLAMGLFAAGEREGAIDALVEIIRRDRTWEEDKARLQLLKFFDIIGTGDPLTAAGRRKLSAVLFS